VTYAILAYLLTGALWIGYFLWLARREKRARDD
jgi:hypothetical protein